MATHLYDDLPTAIAKAVARNVWRSIYTMPLLVLDGVVIFTPVSFSDSDVEEKIREDVQQLGFLFNDDGTGAF